MSRPLSRRCCLSRFLLVSLLALSGPGCGGRSRGSVPDAVPAGGWYPFFGLSEGGRRLRESIDLTVDGNRAHHAFAHQPTAPSRVHATYVAFP